MPPAEFEAKYVYRTKTLLRFRKPRTKQCHFLLDNGCSIHPSKPTQCRAFPFWPELVENRRDWIETAKYCPGIGTGQLIQIGTALEMSQVMQQAYPSMYEKPSK
jgi:Fe-S-cluster containining protein